jgi:hypothetical protein
MSAVINQAAAMAQVAAASSTTPRLVLQPGAVIDARVLAVRDNLARILVAGLALEVLTEVPLQPGANLKLAVSQTAEGVRLAVVPQDAAPRGQGPASAPHAGASPANPTRAATTSASSAAANAGTTTLASLPRMDGASLVPASPEAIAISQAVQTAAPRQASLAPLFANLPVIVASNGVPQQVQTAASTLLATRSPLDATLTADGLRKAFHKSGLFLEATLSRGTPPQGSPDLKAALVVFKQVLTNWLGQGTPSAQPVPTIVSTATIQPAGTADLLPQAMPQNAPQVLAQPPSGAIATPIAANLTAEEAPTRPVGVRTQVLPPAGVVEPRPPASVPAMPIIADPPEPSGEAVRSAAQALTREASAPRGDGGPAADVARPSMNSANQTVAPRQATEPAPPFRGSLPSPQPVATPSVALDTAPASIGHHLLEQTDAALARQTLLQVASLADRPDLASTNQTTQPRWSFEIPFATPQGTAVAQFEISRDGGNEVEAAAPSRVWRARFTLDVEPAGPVHALVSLVGDKTAVRMWAERPETAAQLRAGSDALSEALRQAALEPGDILIGEGAPPQPKPRAGRFLDRAT